MLTSPQAISNFEILLNRNFSENNGKLVIAGTTHESMFREAHGYPTHNQTPKNMPSKRTFRDVVVRNRSGGIEKIVELKCQGAQPQRVAPGNRFQIVLTRRSAGLNIDTPADEAMGKIMSDLHQELDEVMDEAHGNFGISTMIYSNEKVSVWNESGDHLIRLLRRKMKAEWVTNKIGDRSTNSLWITDEETGQKIISYTSNSKTELICRVPEENIMFRLRNEGKFGFLTDSMISRIDRSLCQVNISAEELKILLSDVRDIFREY